jgi:hypothetical protein
MVYAISIILFPFLTVLMAVNVLRIVRIVGKYGLNFFATHEGPNDIERAKIKKYFLYFFLSMIIFVAFIFLLNSIKAID